MLNRQERRHPFSLCRMFYQPQHVFVGVDADLHDAWTEYCSDFPPCDRGLVWLDTEIIPQTPDEYM